MRLGAGFPSLDLDRDPETVRRWAEAVEAIGYHHIAVYEHIVSFDGRAHVGAFGPQDTTSSFHEPFVMFGFLAAVTHSVELVTAVLILPQRQTVLVAKQAAEVDLLSGGRLRLGIGVGWVPEEFAVLNERYDNRGLRSEEQIAVMRALWTEQAVSFDGRWHQLDRAGIAPKPVQQPIPVWIGTHADVGLDRLGRIGDGWFPVFDPIREADAFRAKYDRITTAAVAAGRDPVEIGIDPQVLSRTVPDHDWPGYATAWHDLGATHLTVTTMGNSSNDLAVHIDDLHRIHERLFATGLIDSAG